MTMLVTCSVCDRPVEDQYAPSARCNRCYEPCSTCGGDVALCHHKLTDVHVRHLGDGRYRAEAA